jgi:hypothetical protein
MIWRRALGCVRCMYSTRGCSQYIVPQRNPLGVVYAGCTVGNGEKVLYRAGAEWRLLGAMIGSHGALLSLMWSGP